ncbi:hypothetical protein HETIRDRAFT_451817 [Heterobasidion irregulare TC 32-1]|uniref:Uncharacterized protein n=1 Tax=Heterobasidion irregulare (strain TC 32-1) TaxID=747525 RepID=W4K8U5_HETIT|nr:uncharacterized protein HETIRDRAFT_451817 [Heterobasidion irregulare TC 32-1]ETW82257.1 hypothetical protein HETIRDRAFT_451817 [Heterobasidion irregulare TC 32-1]
MSRLWNITYPHLSQPAGKEYRFAKPRSDRQPRPLSLLSLRHVASPLSTLPSQLVSGSPNNDTPTLQLKQITAVQRDLFFQAPSPHRLLLNPRTAKPYRESASSTHRGPRSFIASPVDLSSHSVRVCRSDAIYTWQRPDLRGVYGHVGEEIRESCG